MRVLPILSIAVALLCCSGESTIAENSAQDSSGPDSAMAVESLPPSAQLDQSPPEDQMEPRESTVARGESMIELADSHLKYGTYSFVDLPGRRALAIYDKGEYKSGFQGVLSGGPDGRRFFSGTYPDSGDVYVFSAAPFQTGFVLAGTIYPDSPGATGYLGFITPEARVPFNNVRFVGTSGVEVASVSPVDNGRFSISGAVIDADTEQWQAWFANLEDLRTLSEIHTLRREDVSVRARASFWDEETLTIFLSTDTVWGEDGFASTVAAVQVAGSRITNQAQFPIPGKLGKVVKLGEYYAIRTRNQVGIVDRNLHLVHLLQVEDQYQPEHILYVCQLEQSRVLIVSGKYLYEFNTLTGDISSTQLEFRKAAGEEPSFAVVVSVVSEIQDGKYLLNFTHFFGVNVMDMRLESLLVDPSSPVSLLTAPEGSLISVSQSEGNLETVPIRDSQNPSLELTRSDPGFRLIWDNH